MAASQPTSAEVRLMKVRCLSRGIPTWCSSGCTMLYLLALAMAGASWNPNPSMLRVPPRIPPSALKSPSMRLPFTLESLEKAEQAEWAHRLVTSSETEASLPRCLVIESSWGHHRSTAMNFKDLLPTLLLGRLKINSFEFRRFAFYMFLGEPHMHNHLTDSHWMAVVLPVQPTHWVM